MPLLKQSDAHLGDKVLPNLSKLQGRVQHVQHCSTPDHHNIRHGTPSCRHDHVVSALIV